MSPPCTKMKPQTVATKLEIANLTTLLEFDRQRTCHLQSLSGSLPDGIRKHSIRECLVKNSENSIFAIKFLSFDCNITFKTNTTAKRKVKSVTVKVRKQPKWSKVSVNSTGIC